MRSLTRHLHRTLLYKVTIIREIVPCSNTNASNCNRELIGVDRRIGEDRCKLDTG